MAVVPDSKAEAPKPAAKESVESRLAKVESAVTHLERIYGFHLGVEDDTDDSDE
jgi:hypothetical protein